MIIAPPAASNPRRSHLVTLEITPLGLLGWDFRVEGAGRPAMTLELTRFRDRGGFTLAGSAYTVIRAGLVRPAFTLERGGVSVARADARGWLLRGYQVAAGERRVEMKRRGLLARYVVEHGRTRLGELRRRGLFTRAAVAQLDERLEPATQLFLVFLALVEWRHQARSHH
jgi:hypothetical protein